MIDDWSNCKNILCIRPDNIGDLLMSSPAITALKETFGCRITVLTSSMAFSIADHMPGIDEVLVYDVPWVKSTSPDAFHDYQLLIRSLVQKRFDAAIVFTVFSQNPLPSVMIAYHANIPKRLGYCRENPYLLLTHWIPDEEPYNFVQHQVKRDLKLVASVGAIVSTDHIKIKFNGRTNCVDEFLSGNELEKIPWMIFHPGVSEQKREYPEQLWIETGRQVVQSLKAKIIVTGSAKEKALCSTIANGIGDDARSAAGLFTLGEFIDLIHRASLVVSVNTATAHIAAAVDTSVIVLYALTNPQHPPWKAKGKIFPFSVDEKLRSKNEVLKFVQQKYFEHHCALPSPQAISEAVGQIIVEKINEEIPELVTTQPTQAQGISSAPYLSEP
jgi:lipopolysaccharide heptosyltransferase II